MNSTLPCVALLMAAIATSALTATSATSPQSTTPNTNAPVQGPLPPPPTDGKGDNGSSGTSGAQPQPAKTPPPSPTDKPQANDGVKPSPAPSETPPNVAEKSSTQSQKSPATNPATTSDKPQASDSAKPSPATSGTLPSAAEKSATTATQQQASTSSPSTPSSTSDKPQANDGAKTSSSSAPNDAEKPATATQKSAVTDAASTTADKPTASTADKPVSFDKPADTASSPAANQLTTSGAEGSATANTKLPVPAKPADPEPAPPKPAASAAAASPQPEPRARGMSWRPLDSISIVVNEDMFTHQMEQRDLTNGRVPPKEQPNVLMQIRQQRVMRFLEQQAGQDMGIDPKVVARQVTDNVEVLVRERFNGVAGLADFMQSKDMDSIELRDQLKNELYVELWEKYITGESPIPGSRISRDRFVRPGILKLYFENGIQDPENLELVGGKQQEVVLQYLFIDEAQYGGAEKARELLSTLRQRILDGEDMGDICERYSAAHAAKKDRGIMQARPEARFKDLDPAIGAFLAGAKPGDVSDLMPYKSGEDEKRFWRIVKLVERTSAVVPELQSREVQQKLLKRIQDDYDGVRKRAALAELFHASYVWPTELSQRSEPPPR